MCITLEVPIAHNLSVHTPFVYKDRMLCTMMIIFIITTLSFCWSCFSLSLFYFKYLPVRRSAAYWSIYTTDMYKYVWIYIYYNLYIVLLMCAWQSLPDKSSLTGNYQPYDNMSLNMIWWISILIQTINIFLKQNCYNMWNWTMNVFSRVYYTFLLPLLLGSIKYFFFLFWTEFFVPVPTFHHIMCVFLLDFSLYHFADHINIEICNK